MFKPARVFLGIIVLISILAALPVPASNAFRGFLYSFFRTPLTVSSAIGQAAADLFYFKRNADDRRLLQREAARLQDAEFQSRELWMENQRLSRFLDLRQKPPHGSERAVFSRVISRSPASWNRIVLIDKGSKHGLRVNQPVIAGASLVGKIAGTAPSVSKVLLITDPNSKIGVMVQRTRQQGILYGTTAGGCRVKYLSLDAELRTGDVVETAGHGIFAAKRLLIGNIKKAWKEPGQIYQVADIRPLMDLSRLEEVAVLE